jgi:hypothetical protein
MSIRAQAAIEELVLIETVDLALLREAACALEPDPTFEPEAPVDLVLLASEEGRAALKRVGKQVGIYFERWLEQNGARLDAVERGYLSRVARGCVPAQSLGLLRAMIKLHTAGHEPRDLFERFSVLDKRAPTN